MQSPPTYRTDVRVPAPSGEEGLGGQGMRQGAGIGRFTAPLAVLAALVVAPIADAASLARQCRQACGDEIAACVAAGGRHLACKRQTLRRCRREGLAVCWGPAAGGNTTAPTARVPLPHLAHGDHHVPVSRIERSSGTGRDVPRGPLVKQRRPRSQRWDCTCATERNQPNVDRYQCQI